jgi:hypothetical protein
MRNRFPRNCRIQLGSLENVVLLTGDRKFESISLQRRVACEHETFGEGSADPRAFFAPKLLTAYGRWSRSAAGWTRLARTRYPTMTKVMLAMLILS